MADICLVVPSRNYGVVEDVHLILNHVLSQYFRRRNQEAASEMVGAIDIGGTKTIVALVQEDGTIVDSERFPTCRAHCEAHLDACCEALQRLLRGQGLDVRCLSGIGATVPGIVDEKGQMACALRISGLERKAHRAHAGRAYGRLPRAY